MSQSRLGSLCESLTNVAIGFTVSWLASLVVFPLFGVHTSPAQNAGITLIYTGISIVRSYVVRRWFNANLHRENQ